ncbi:MAG: cell division protein FtsA [Alphaproteobacteria bacterium]
MSKGKTRSGVIAALDVGTSKVCCFIARSDGEALQVVGIGHQICRGLRAGAVVDMAAAEESILAAVHAAEQMAGETIRDVHLNFSTGNPTSHRIGVEVALNGHEIGNSDLRRVLNHGRLRCQAGDREIVHSIPLGYTIDGNCGIRDPRGMFGDRLGVNIHVVTADSGPLRNLNTCVARCHLDIAACVVSPYASGFACLVDDEKELGVTLIDMGGGSTGAAVFLEGDVAHTDVVPVGGNHITNDIARGLSTPIDHAERMKALYGSAIASVADERETIDVRRVGENEESGANPVPRSYLVSIIRPRVEETFELLRSRLEAAGFDKAAGRRLVLTGGASQLQGVRDLAAQVFDKQVRLGRPQGFAGLAEATAGPAFSTCAGLLGYALAERGDSSSHAAGAPDGTGGRLDRIGQWFREYL